MPRFSIPFESENPFIAERCTRAFWNDGKREKEMEKDSFRNAGVCLT